MFSMISIDWFKFKLRYFLFNAERQFLDIVIYFILFYRNVNDCFFKKVLSQ